MGLLMTSRDVDPRDGDYHDDDSSENSSGHPNYKNGALCFVSLYHGQSFLLKEPQEP